MSGSRRWRKVDVRAPHDPRKTTRFSRRQSPGEIKRREVSWTLTKELDFYLRGQARSRGGRWSWTLKRAQKRSRAGRWSWAQKVGLLLLHLFLNSSATDIALVNLLRTAVGIATAWYTIVTRGHCLLFWRRSTTSSVFRIGARGRAFTLSPLSPSLISHLASVDVKQNVYLLSRRKQKIVANCPMPLTYVWSRL